ncbi:MAG: MotA/TolQ/ExbB proton channel family protein [Deltaproteobacteria bacterium]|nr:MotA/TolQ/ExbB proton channel family protein [Deltaproteobacteria bacterium]
MTQMLLLIAGLAIFSLFIGNVVGDLSDMTNLKSYLLVFGGTLICGFMAFPLKTFRGLLKSLHQVFRHDEGDNKTLLYEIETLAHVRWLYGIRELEKEGKRAGNHFLRKGIEFIVDDYPREEIDEIMDRDFDIYLSGKMAQVNILNTLAKLAPAIGFVGTIIGLISVLNNMQNPDEIGKGMSLALLTTLYGSLLSHFLFVPLAKKLSEYTRTECIQLSIIKEGVMAISDKKNPKVVSHHLQSYLTTHSLQDARSPDTLSPSGNLPEKSFFQRLLMKKETG